MLYGCRRATARLYRARPQRGGVSGYSEYLDAVDLLKKRFKVAASTEDWLGLPLVIFRVGGNEEPPALVTAGAAGVEAAGVYAALELVLKVDVERTVYVLPSRDPTGFHGASYVLSKMLGEEVRVETPFDAKKLLASAGAEVLLDTSDLFLALFKGVGFAIGSADAYDAKALLERELISRELADSLDGTRILLAAQLPHAEGVGGLNRLLTLIVKDGRVLTYEDLETESVPEVEFVRSFVERENLGMVVDLHEDKRAPAFFVSQSEEPSSGELTILYLVLDQVKQYGMDLADREAIEALGLKAVSDGVGYRKGFCGLTDYACMKAYAFAFVTPFAKPLEARVRTLGVAALSALNAFAIAC